MESFSEPNTCIYNLSFNGTKFNDLNTGTTSATNYISPIFIPACINLVVVKNPIGINDYYANGMTGPQFNANHTNFAAIYHGYGFQYWPFTLFGIGTNGNTAAGAPYTYSAATETNIFVGNFCSSPMLGCLMHCRAGIGGSRKII